MNTALALKLEEPHAAPRASNVVLRQVAMLQLLPVHPRRIGTKEIGEQLAALGFRATKRTLQRDLIALKSVLPIELAGKGRPYAWRWSREADPHPLPVAIGSPPVRVVALVTPGVLRRLGDVSVRPDSDGRLRVTMTVPGGPALERWVLGFGDGMEVIEPASLREDLRELTERAATRYQAR